MNVKWFFLVVAGALSLSACGVKPDTLEPPPGAEGETFPHTYPSPETDNKL